jgi:hypothetical protein
MGGRCIRLLPIGPGISRGKDQTQRGRSSTDSDQPGSVRGAGYRAPVRYRRAGLRPTVPGICGVENGTGRRDVSPARRNQSAAVSRRGHRNPALARLRGPDPEDSRGRGCVKEGVEAIPSQELGTIGRGGDGQPGIVRRPRTGPGRPRIAGEENSSTESSTGNGTPAK